MYSPVWQIQFFGDQGSGIYAWIPSRSALGYADDLGKFSFPFAVQTIGRLVLFQIQKRPRTVCRYRLRNTVTDDFVEASDFLVIDPTTVCV